MFRQFKKTKPLIYVFCEGESEQAYTDFLKKQFQDVAVIKRPSSTGLFDEADALFKNNIKYKNSAEVTDEIWFFFDVETKDIGKWNDRITIIKRLRKLRKNPNIRVRLLMTTGCIEYWLMLHYKMYVPPLQTVAEKERVTWIIHGGIISHKIRRSYRYNHSQYPTLPQNSLKMGRLFL